MNEKRKGKIWKKIRREKSEENDFKGKKRNGRKRN